MDNKKRLIWVILPGIAFVLLFFQLPNLLKAVPSRYVARLPEAVQALGERGDGVPILPTVSAPLEAAVLLTELASPMPTIPATAVSAPPTPTSIPVGSKRSAVDFNPRFQPAVDALTRLNK